VTLPHPPKVPRVLVLAVACVLAAAIGIGMRSQTGTPTAHGQGAAQCAGTYYFPANSPPSADFAYSPSNPTAGQQVRFDSTARDPDNKPQPLRHEWQLDGDPEIDAVTPRVERSFPQAGQYAVTLRVNDGCDDDAITKFLVVSAAPDDAGPVIVIPSGKNRRIRLSRRGFFRFLLGPFAEEVSGRVGFKTPRPVPVSRATASLRRRATLNFGRKRVAAPAGRRVAVRVRLSRRNRRILANLKRVRVRARIVLSDTDENTSRARFTFTLLAPRR
jgi:PKD domain